jgi:hypothetical protein
LQLSVKNTVRIEALMQYANDLNSFGSEPVEQNMRRDANRSHAGNNVIAFATELLALSPRALLGRSRQFPVSCLAQLAGTRAGGFVLTRQEAPGKWGKVTYSLARTSKAQGA